MENNKQPEHILVCLSSSPSNAKIINSAASLVTSLNGIFTAIYIKTKDEDKLTQESKERLQENINLAKRLGANIVNVLSDDIAISICEYALLSNVTKIVVGKDTKKKLFKTSLVDKIIANNKSSDIYIIPDDKIITKDNKFKPFSKRTVISTLFDVFIATLFILMCSAIGLIFNISESSIIIIYLLGVLLTSIFTNSYISWTYCPIFSVLAFNFLFIEPIYSFRFERGEYFITFGVMFIVSFTTGIITSRIKNIASKSSKSSYRTNLLFEASQKLSKAENEKQIFEVSASIISKLMTKDVVIIDDNGNIIKNENLNINQDDIKEATSYIKNKNIIDEPKRYNDNLFYSLNYNEEIYGVIIIVNAIKDIEPFESSILNSIIGEASLAIYSKRTQIAKEESLLIAQNETMRANLLRSISHDLRTPLTAISGNAANLIANNKIIDNQTKNAIYNDIYDDAMWLNNIFENLLSITRLEDSNIKLTFQDELIDDIIEEAIKHVNKKENDKIIYQTNDNLLFVKVEPHLIMQVIINIVDNAIKYGNDKTNVIINTKELDNEIEISISDDGKGISDENKEHIFDMFYTGKTKISDGKRSLGLGLFLVKQIIQAHGGKIEVKDNKPCGSIFVFTLPKGGNNCE